MGFTETEAANMKAYLGLSNFDLTLLPSGHTKLTQDSFKGSSYKHLLVLARTSTGDLIGGYTGENYFKATLTDTWSARVGGEFIFNVTKGIKQLPDIQPLYTLHTLGQNNNYGAKFGHFTIMIYQKSYDYKAYYGAGQTVNVLGNPGLTEFTVNEMAHYIVTPK